MIALQSPDGACRTCKRDSEAMARPVTALRAANTPGRAVLYGDGRWPSSDSLDAASAAARVPPSPFDARGEGVACGHVSRAQLRDALSL